MDGDGIQNKEQKENLLDQSSRKQIKTSVSVNSGSNGQTGDTVSPIGSNAITHDSNKALFSSLLNQTGLTELDHNTLYDKNLTKILANMWEKDSNSGSTSPQDVSGRALESPVARNRKRKSSALDGPADSTDGEVDALSGSGRGLNSKPSQRNVLLAQLLSKKAATETVINTRLTISANSLPQAKLPKNIGTKSVDGTIGKSSQANVLTSSSPDLPSSTGLVLSQARVDTKNNSLWDVANPDTCGSDSNELFTGNLTQSIISNKTDLDTPTLPVQSLSVKTTVGSTDIMSSVGLPSSIGNLPIPGSTHNNVVSNRKASNSLDLDTLLAGTGSGSCNSDQLSDILQTAMEMQDGLGDAALSNSQPNQTQNTTSGPGIVDDPLISQLEKAINSSNITMAELDALLGLTTSVVSQSPTPQPTGPGNYIPNDLSEQMAIDAIQHELMRIDPVTSTDGGTLSTNTILMTNSLEGLTNLSQAVGSRPPNSSALISSGLQKNTNGLGAVSSGSAGLPSPVTPVDDLRRPALQHPPQALNVRQQLQQQLQQAHMQRQMNSGRRGPRLPQPHGKQSFPVICWLYYV